MNRLTQDGTLFSVTVEGNTTFYFVSDREKWDSTFYSLRDRAGVAAKCYFKDPSVVDGKAGLVRISGTVIEIEHDEENLFVYVRSIILVDEVEIRQPWLSFVLGLDSY